MAKQNRTQPCKNERERQKQARLAAIPPDPKDFADPKPSHSIKEWLKGKQKAEKSNWQSEDEAPSQKRFESNSLANSSASGLHAKAKEDPQCVGLQSDSFFWCPWLRSVLFGLQDTFVLSNYTGKEVVAIGLFTKFKDMSESFLESVQHVTQTLKQLETVQSRIPVHHNGAMMGGVMFADGFRNCSMGIGLLFSHF